ncbi:cupredoxin domain-containing protein [Candidatus Gottesmanbacteria bacterium]|nr:cupredoxin domain-containing protein [Candidatus Gottesmanbacteria bacterium]
MDKIIVTIFGIAAIAFTYWFFLGKKEEVVEVKDKIDILVEGGYKPNTIRVPKSKSITISFLRKDSNPCLEEVVIPDFKIKKFLPVGEKVDVTIKPEKSGTIPFSCGMNMFHGKIIVSA